MLAKDSCGVSHCSSLRQPEHPFGNDVALDLGGAAGDGAGEDSQYRSNQLAVKTSLLSGLCGPVLAVRSSAADPRASIARLYACWPASEPISLRIDCSAGSLPWAILATVRYPSRRSAWWH